MGGGKLEKLGRHAVEVGYDLTFGESKLKCLYFYGGQVINDKWMGVTNPIVSI
jgi:hypothetical protein